MTGEAGRRFRDMPVGLTTPLDTYLFNFINHHGLQEAKEIFSTLGDCRAEETMEAFRKMIKDFSNKPLEVDEDDDKDRDQDQDLEDDKDKDEDKDVDEGEAEGKTSKLFGTTKKANLVKRLHAPVGSELEPKKPRIAENSCVHGDETEAAGVENSSLQGLMTG